MTHADDGIAPWDRALLGKCSCGSTSWLAGPEGGCSQMFKCADCGNKVVVHPGRVEPVLDKLESAGVSPPIGQDCQNGPETSVESMPSRIAQLEAALGEAQTELRETQEELEKVLADPEEKVSAQLARLLEQSDKVLHDALDRLGAPSSRTDEQGRVLYGGSLVRLEWLAKDLRTQLEAARRERDEARQRVAQSDRMGRDAYAVYESQLAAVEAGAVALRAALDALVEEQTTPYGKRSPSDDFLQTAVTALSSAVGQESLAAIRELVQVARIGLQYVKAALPPAPGHSCGPEAGCDMECVAFAYAARDEHALEKALAAPALRRLVGEGETNG